MTRRIAGTIATVAIASAVVVMSPGTASAAPTPLQDACTATGTQDVPNTVWINGTPVTFGTSRHSYVGSRVLGLSTYRFWHVSYQSTGSSSWVYQGGYAVRCTGATQNSTTDLTRTTLTPSGDDLCGAGDFGYDRYNPAGEVTTYRYSLVGTRTDSGDTFRYWSLRVTGPSTVIVTPTAARCD